MDYRRTAKELLNEHPQTIAVALSRLPAEHAGEILKLLPGFIQADLVNRIVQTDQLPTVVVEEIDRLLDRLIR
ncbi:magnesium and cobalt transport protein CorA [Trichlorobacter lovleyi]|uniref:Flagellar motor switch protein FliG n=1 Tax=Trichlorobacter lovleyi (strain ATCC BAA-1151 / DSM 17278 / SZ) TaxID=398767 RepID=B3E2V3_TRIL1|nr:flagellar motor switch protein FliG [Trichlorobacter lovleyi]ACD97213.1 flagellar motor switch protein FliG [Trichlorobacter lovleyi SZ]